MPCALTTTPRPFHASSGVSLHHRSSRRSLVFFASTLIAAGPSVTRSWYANNTSAHPCRPRMRWDVPLCRLILHPIRGSAASACLAFVEGQSAAPLLGRNEAHIHRTRNRLPMLQPVRDQSQRQRLDRRGRLLPCPSRRRHPGKSGNVGQPPPIFLPVVLNRKRKFAHRRRLPHATIMPLIHADSLIHQPRTRP